MNCRLTSRVARRRLALAVWSAAGLLALAPAGRANDSLPSPEHERSLNWDRAALAVAYRRAGDRNAAWDQQALQALELAAQAHAGSTDTNLTSQLLTASQAALDAGC